MVRYTTVLFDLFDTLVRFNRERLPAVQINGREVRSSVARLFPVAQAALPGLTIATFYEAFAWSYQEAERRRAADHREITAAQRWELCYARLDIDPRSVPPELTERLLQLHVCCLAQAAEPVPGRAELLGWLRGRFRLGVVSNFDYSPGVRRILADGGIAECFEVVVVSDAVGWRKPTAAIFRVAFERMRVTPTECLFIGDRPEIDVAGAKGVGMAAAWLNTTNTPLPAGLPAPDFVLAGLADLPPILEATSSRLLRDRRAPS